MEYSLDLGAWNAVFAVPCALVDRHIKLAGKEQLQVILWVLRRPSQRFTIEDLSAGLDMKPEQAEEALEFWVQRGLLAQTGRDFAPVPQPEEAAGPGAKRQTKATEPVGRAEPVPQTEPAGQTTPPPRAPRQRMVKPNADYLAARMKESATLRQLLQEAELTLGLLSPAMTNVILAGCDDYGLPPEVLVMLLHYAKDVGKTSTAYIESVVRDWSDSGIFTLSAAEEKLQQLSDRRMAWNRVCAAAGLTKRSPSKKEEEAAYRWVFEWKFPHDMLAAAYERCVDNTGKFSAAYMNRVLERWQKEGLRTVADVDRAEENKKEQTDRPKSYSLEDAENLSFFNLPEDL